MRRKVMIKSNWFRISGDFRTNNMMTTREFEEFLIKILEEREVEFLGSIKYSNIKDEDYK